MKKTSGLDPRLLGCLFALCLVTAACSRSVHPEIAAGNGKIIDGGGGYKAKISFVKASLQRGSGLIRKKMALSLLRSACRDLPTMDAAKVESAAKLLEKHASYFESAIEARDISATEEPLALAFPDGKSEPVQAVYDPATRAIRIHHSTFTHSASLVDADGQVTLSPLAVTVHEMVHDAGEGDFSAAPGFRYNLDLLNLAGICFEKYLAAVSNPADLAPDAGIAGVTALSTGYYDETPARMVVQADGKVVVVTNRETRDPGANPHDIVVYRRNPDGSPDREFNGTGSLVIDSLAAYRTPGAQWFAQAVAIQSDGSLLVAGYDLIPGARLFALVLRISSTGVLDTAFADRFYQFQLARNRYSLAYAVAFDRDGKIVVAGFDGIDLQRKLAVLRLLPNGSPDPDFGDAGWFTTMVAGLPSTARALAVAPDGSIVAGGNNFLATGSGDTPSAAVVTRVLPNGLKDASFGEKGDFALTLASGGVEGRSLRVLSDGKILLGARTAKSFVVARVGPDGRLDPAFGNAGVRSVDFKKLASYSDLEIHQVAGEKILIAGWGTDGARAVGALARLLSDGKDDATFTSSAGETGTVSLVLGAGDTELHGSAVTADGRIAVAARTGLVGAGGLVERAPVLSFLFGSAVE